VANGDGILGGPIDLNGSRFNKKEYPRVPAERGLVVEYLAEQLAGAIVRFAPGEVVLRDRHGRDHKYRPTEGSFAIDGRRISLVPPAAKVDTAPQRTASGSIAVGDVPARMARASRIYVEGIHDAELLEKVWGDDLRIEGVVVEQMEGMDDLGELVRTFQPREGRRLGVLLDHLVPGTKESRIAAEVDHPDVLITGHPYVDIWEAIKPEVVGIDAWPTVPMGTDWKTGVLEQLGVHEHPGVFWKQLLSQVSSYRHVQSPLIGAVEELIDFVAPPED